MSKFTAEDIRLAQETEAAYGVPASVTLAQYALESGYGSSKLATQANNYFGITGSNKNTGASVTMSGRSWAAYDSKAESFYDHGRLLSTPLYANAHKNTTDAGAYIDAIAEIYAPSSDGNNNYAGKLKSIIQTNNLTQYDQGLSGSMVSGGTASGGGVVVSGSSDDASKLEIILGKIVKFLALFIVGLMAAVFFFNAFNFKINPKKAMKKAVKTDGG